ncbi:hypothetical protein NW762_005561 [Fusarium torreyae]|uniref:Uncharacterized protein n=1 Tax=Fusarium torreyae TaxID=1237075 RepID=A0A9W8VF08_9HYPO|nr:hypothetical protein NW762_005561 [Fusarium torreyae]
MRQPLLEDLDFEEAYQIFNVCARSLGTSPSDIYRKGHASQVSSSAIKRPFFFGEHIIKHIEPGDYVVIIANELLTMAVALLPNLVHLGIERGPRRSYTGPSFCKIDVSPATLDALGITALRLKTLQSDYAPKQLLSRTPNLETLATGIYDSFPGMPSVRNLHIQGQVSIRRHLKKCLSACTGPLSTFSYTAEDIEISDVIECLDYARFHTSLESLYLLQRLESESLVMKPIPSLKLFTKLKTIFIPTDHISTSSLEAPQLVDVLPSNITSFTLVRRDTPVDFTMEDLQRLTKTKPTAFASPRVTKASEEKERVGLDYLWAASDSR